MKSTSVLPDPSKARTTSETAKLFAYYVDTGHFNQREIAIMAGYTRPNIITMFKTGDTKIPLDKVPVLSEILGIDPKKFLRVALKEYMPELLETIESVQSVIVTDNEVEILKELRGLTNDTDPELAASEQREALRMFAESLTG